MIFEATAVHVASEAHECGLELSWVPGMKMLCGHLSLSFGIEIERYLFSGI